MLKAAAATLIIGIIAAPVAGTVGQYNETEPAIKTEVSYEAVNTNVDQGAKYVGLPEEEIDLSDSWEVEEDIQLDW